LVQISEQRGIIEGLVDQASNSGAGTLIQLSLRANFRKSDQPPPMPNNSADAQALHALSQLTLSPENHRAALGYLAGLNEEGRAHFESVADSNHVVIRALRAAQAGANGRAELAAWAGEVITRQEQRIQNALTFLQRICAELEIAGCPVTVMKSLDHWPDLGNDLDLYTTADEGRVKQVMVTRMAAHLESRSWGDRLANKWNFCVPGLPELIEVHAKRLGQTGEQTTMARRFVNRRVAKTVGGFTFLVPAPEERVIVATLQRMYRHFYFRVCDIVNTIALLEAGEIDFRELRCAADLGGVWNGVATFLKIVCDYTCKYRGSAPNLPAEVSQAACFGGEAVYAGGRFLRIPVVPKGAELYARQVVSVASRGDVPATMRLSLLPPLASAAAVAYRLTGSDKGVW
jgi:hypothetical protein